MGKKIKENKILIYVIVGVILVLLANHIVGIVQENQRQMRSHRTQSKLVYNVIHVKGERPEIGNIEPQEADMDGTNGLGFKVMAYNHFNHENLDPYQIAELLRTEGPSATYDQYKDFISWAANHPGALANYQTALEKAYGEGITSLSYEELKALAEQYKDVFPEYLPNLPGNQG